MKNRNNNRNDRDKAYNIREIYQEMELELIRSMKRNLERHKEEELKQGFKFEQWQAAKLRDLERFRRENKRIIDKYDDAIKKGIIYTLLDMYDRGQQKFIEFVRKAKKEIENIVIRPSTRLDRVVENIKTVKVQPIEPQFFRVNDGKFNALMETVEKDFSNANAAVLRRMDDVYKQTIFRAQVHYNTGTVSLDQAIDMATKDFLAKGIDAITYSDGKKVNIASYAEMALRTANHRAYLMAEGKKRQEMGLYLVVVSAHATACELCVPWQGKIIIDDVYGGGSKEVGDYPLLSEAMEAGLLHPNCRHNLSTYFPGITTLPKVPDMEGVEENYKREQQQRHIERQIRKYKRLAEGSIDEENRKKYNAKVREWQKIMRNFLEENPQLRRSYRREKVY